MTADRYQGFVFDPEDLAEEADLTLEERKTILYAHAHLSAWNHFQVLGLPWDAPMEAIRDAYLERVKVFHPDRYPGKRLGRYRARLEQVFHKVAEARDLLQDPKRRADYVKKSAPPEEFARAEVRRIEQAQRAEERRSRLVRNNPILARAGKVAELMRRGRRSMEDGRFAQAANDFLTAASLDPKNLEIQTLAQEAKKRAEVDRGKDAYDRGMAAEALGNWKLAQACCDEAVKASPENPRYAVALARSALLGGDLETALASAEAAVRLGPNSAQAHDILGAILAAQGQKAQAKKALEKALEIDPNLESARERLKKLRWSLFG